MANYKLYTWIAAGKQRKAVLKAMYEPQTPTQIRRNSNHYNGKISLNNTSDILRGFVEKKLAICLNPEARKGRLYKLTEEGEKIRTELMKGQKQKIIISHSLFVLLLLP